MRVVGGGAWSAGGEQTRCALTAPGGGCRCKVPAAGPVEQETLNCLQLHTSQGLLLLHCVSQHSTTLLLTHLPLNPAINTLSCSSCSMLLRTCRGRGGVCACVRVNTGWVGGWVECVCKE